MQRNCSALSVGSLGLEFASLCPGAGGRLQSLMSVMMQCILLTTKDRTEPTSKDMQRAHQHDAHGVSV
jgi:hypothetical protein